MAQHLHFPQSNRNRGDLAPASPKLESEEEVHRQSELFAALESSGLHLRFNAALGEYEVVERATGRSIPDTGRRYLTYVRQGKPPLRTVMRAWTRQLETLEKEQ